MSAHLLVEIGTEELPPKALRRLSQAFTDGVVAGLKDAGFDIGEIKSYAAPRRLAVLVADVPASQPDREVERKGPALKAAFDADGNPTKAVMGFAKSCGVEVDQLEQQETPKGTWLVFRATEQGKQLSELIAAIVEQSLAKLPIPKRMRWGDKSVEFVRPVHWIVMMHGDQVLPGEVMQIAAGNTTRGHRFHANKDIVIDRAENYADLLEQNGSVIADFDRRMERIREQVLATVKEVGGQVNFDADLLDEVAALNEWPTPVLGQFDEAFLDVPSEALIKTMKDNQKYFPVEDDNGGLMNCFITISNIDSRSPEKVKAGNERVVRPRLEDARFFWQQDQKQPLEAFAPSLDKVVFQKELGSIGDKTRRIATLAAAIADMIGADNSHAARAAQLSKCDLMTNMVGEFASLQGVMGKRYAERSGEPADVAIALDEQYMPRGASDDTAANAVGQCLAIADKLDTLVGIFAIGQKPTGEKDPYALRRASLGILRTVIERDLDLDLKAMIAVAVEALAGKVDAAAAGEEVFEFMLERLRAYYHDRGVEPDVFDAVSALKPSRPLDFDKRVRAVQAFRNMPEAESLAAANKRVSNILKKSGERSSADVDTGLFDSSEEKALYATMADLRASVEPLFAAGDYEQALERLSALREPVDAFFDGVMVMADDEAVKNNRIALLSSMSSLFMQAADLSRLQG